MPFASTDLSLTQTNFSQNKQELYQQLANIQGKPITAGQLLIAINEMLHTAEQQDVHLAHSKDWPNNIQFENPNPCCFVIIIYGHCPVTTF